MSEKKPRDPLAGMPVAVRADYDKAPRVVREVYKQWWQDRPDRAAAHRDTWPAFFAGWKAHGSVTKVSRAA